MGTSAQHKAIGGPRIALARTLNEKSLSTLYVLKDRYELKCPFAGEGSLELRPFIGENQTMDSSQATRVSFLNRLRDVHDGPSWSLFRERYGQMLYQYARARGASHADADDAVQEVQMQLVKSIGQFEYDPARGRFRAYLRTAILHALSRRARRQSRQPASVDPDGLHHVRDNGHDASDAVWNREWDRQQLRWAVRLARDEFEHMTMHAFELHAIVGFSVNETAETLGISKWRVYRARERVSQRVRAILTDLAQEDAPNPA